MKRTKQEYKSFGMSTMSKKDIQSKSNVYWKFDAIIGHREVAGQLQVLIQWTNSFNEQSWDPSWEPLGAISEDEEQICRECAEKHDLLDVWSECV